MDEELENRLIDYFDAWDLVELLGITTREIVEAFSDKIEDNCEMLEDYVLNGD